MCSHMHSQPAPPPRKPEELLEEAERRKKQRSALSDDLKLACEIWHYASIGERVWFTKLVDSLSWCMTKQQVSHSLDTCIDWMIIYGEYGETEKGRAGRLYLVDTHDGGDYRIRDLYEKHWKHERQRRQSTGTQFQENHLR